eukprot:PhF_6_TR26091/c0_g1_i2/m.36851
MSTSSSFSGGLGVASMPRVTPNTTGGRRTRGVTVAKVNPLPTPGTRSRQPSMTKETALNVVNINSRNQNNNSSTKLTTNQRGMRKNSSTSSITDSPLTLTIPVSSSLRRRSSPANSDKSNESDALDELRMQLAQKERDLQQCVDLGQSLVGQITALRNTVSLLEGDLDSHQNELQAVYARHAHEVKRLETELNQLRHYEMIHETMQKANTAMKAELDQLKRNNHGLQHRLTTQETATFLERYTNLNSTRDLIDLHRKGQQQEEELLKKTFHGWEIWSMKRMNVKLRVQNAALCVRADQLRFTTDVCSNVISNSRSGHRAGDHQNDDAAVIGLGKCAGSVMMDVLCL